MEKITAYKGFDADWRCRGMQYAVGQTFEHRGEVSACSSGLHACEDPLHVLKYYRPEASKFAIVEQFGALSRHGEDSKVASASLSVIRELSLAELIGAGVDYRIARCAFVRGSFTKTPRGAATASGSYGAATASGWHGAATASGESGAATASGENGAATASHSTAVACAPLYGKAKGVEGAALFLTYRSADGAILHAKALIVGRDGVQPDRFYRLNAQGEAELAL